MIYFTLIRECVLLVLFNVRSFAMIVVALARGQLLHGFGVRAGDLSRALPYLIRRLWHPVSPHDINAELAEDHAALRSQLRQSMQLYELGVKRVSQHGQATAESIVSAITQLVHHGEGNVQFTQSAAARGLHVAVSSLVQPEVGSVKASHRKTIARLHTAQELVYSCLAYYIPSADTGEPMPMLNIGDCRHSTTLISQALSQHNPISTVPMLRTMTSVAGDKARVRLDLFKYGAVELH